MPFAKKAHQPSSSSARSIFVGRANELLFFVQHILKPEEPTHNILSIWGQGGVGKTTLLQQFRNQTATADFKAYCLTALVDERQTTPASMMEKFAQQLPVSNNFEKALHRYKEALSLPTIPRPASPFQQTMVKSAPDLAGALLEGTPIAGPILREVTKAATGHLLNHPRTTTQEHQEAVRLNSPLDTLTQVFVTELNHLATTKGTLPSVRTKRERRILLFFDTFEQVASEAVPWLLHSVLEQEIHPNIVFIIAGRDPLERSTAAGPKQWLPYYDTHTLYSLPLETFTQEETSAYLTERGITTKEQLETIWHLSHGLPLYLGLLTANTQGMLDPTKDVVDNFLHHIPETEQTKRQLALDGALFSRPFNLDDFEALPYLSDENRPTLYEWLLHQPFVHTSSISGCFIYHELAQELFQRYLLQYSPRIYYATRRTLAAYYQRVLEYLQTVQEKNRYRPSDERLEVMLALASQRFFLPDEESHLQALLPIIDILEYNDPEQVYTLIRMLRHTLQKLSLTPGGTHAQQVTQVFLHFIETRPDEFDPKNKQKWLQVTYQLFQLIKRSSALLSELSAHIYYCCGWGYQWLNEYQEAIMSFERALELHPLSAKVHKGLGFTYHSLKDYQQALNHFNQGLKLAPHLPHLYLGRGRAYGRLKAYQQALSDLDYALQLDWRLIGSYNNRARIYMELGEHGKALADLDHALEIEPAHPIARMIEFQRGCIYLLLKDILHAKTCFMHSHELTSTENLPLWVGEWTENLSLWAREWSAMCQIYPGSQALQRLGAIAEGDHYIAHVSQGVILFLQKELEPALRELEYATTLHFDDIWQNLVGTYWREWDVHFWLAMVYIALDQEAEARKAIEQALAFGMPPILLKPLSWFEQEKPKLYEQLVRPLFDTYDV